VTSSVEKKPMKLRLPQIPNEELIKRAKEYSPVPGWIAVMESPSRYGENLFYCTVPEIFAADITYWTRIVALINDFDPSLPPDEIIRLGVTAEPKGEPYKRYMLMSSWLHNVHMKNGWTRTIMGGWASEGAGITRAKLLLLDLPDDDIWTDEERLALKFVKASFEWEMTDELWEAAQDAWGERWLLSVLALLVHYYGYSLRFSAIGLDRVLGLSDDVPLAQLLGLAPPDAT
jgi:hypothetical protein